MRTAFPSIIKSAVRRSGVTACYHRPVRRCLPFVAGARGLFEIDARPLLPLIHAPTLVLHRTGYPMIPIEHGRYLAEHIPDARLVELPGADGLLAYQAADIALDHVEEFLGNLRRPV